VLLPLPGNPRMMYSVLFMLFVVEYPSVHPEKYVGSYELKCYHAHGDAPFKDILKQPQARVADYETSLPPDVVLNVSSQHTIIIVTSIRLRNYLSDHESIVFTDTKLQFTSLVPSQSFNYIIRQLEI
jgi:hypothetical protein